MGGGQGCKEEVPQTEGGHIDNYSFAFANNGKEDNQDAAWQPQQRQQRDGDSDGVCIYACNCNGGWQASGGWWRPNWWRMITMGKWEQTWVQ